jgi:cell division transport system permease protein
MNKKLYSTLKHIRRSPYQALAAVSVLTITFLAASILALLSLGSQQILLYFETRPQVTAFFSDTATQQDITSLKEKLDSSQIVSSTKYVSKDEALSIYKEQNKNDPLLLEMVTAEILPASLEVAGINAQVLPEIAELMTNQPGVEELAYQKDVVDALKNWTKSIRIAGISLVTFLTVTSIFVMVIIISMKISIRRREISILKLLGASPWYIKSPFLIEGLIYGVSAAVIAWGITYVLLLYSTPFLVSFLAEIPLLPVSPLTMLALLLVAVLFSVVIGSISSLIAVHRYLKR